MRRVLILLLLALPPSGPVRAEEPADPLDSAFTRLRDEGLSRCGTYRLLADLLRTAPRRLSGSPAAAKAVAWARRAMEGAGLSNVHLEPVTVPHWERGAPESLRFAGPPAAAGDPLPVLALGGSVATPEGGITAEVIAVQGFEELASRAEEARGRIVLFNRPMDRTLVDPVKAYGGAVDQRVRGAIEAAKAGAVAVVVRSMTTRIDDVPHTGGMRYEEGVKRIPAAAVSTAGAERIAALLAVGQTVALHLELHCRWRDPAPSANVVGEIPGVERPEEIVVVGAHLDSWDVGQGAHDDGAGCAQAIEAARLLLDLGLTPRRTVRVVLFMNEENGLAGGRAYAKDHADELPRHVLALESDAGGFTPRGFTTNANPASREILAAIAGRLEGIGAGRVLPGGGGADISPMAKAGVIQVGYLPDLQR